MFRLNSASMDLSRRGRKVRYMKTIYKYPLEIREGQCVDMPEGAIILSVQLQNDKPQLWVLVDTLRPLESRYIKIYGTGNPCDGSPNKFIGTFQMNDGRLVWHVFERDL